MRADERQRREEMRMQQIVLGLPPEELKAKQKKIEYLDYLRNLKLEREKQQALSLEAVDDPCNSNFAECIEAYLQ